MAMKNGFGGSVSWNSVSYSVTTWQINDSAEILETTSTGDSGVHTAIVGMRKCEGSFTFLVDFATLPFDATEVRAGVSATIELLLGDSTKKYTCTALLSQVSVTNAAKGVVECTANFVSTGALTHPSGA